MSRIILIFSYETKNEEIIEKIKLAEKFNYKTIIIKFCNNEKLDFYSYKNFDYNKILEKISVISNLLNKDNLLFNIDATDISLEFLLDKIIFFNIKKNNLFLDYFIDKEFKNKETVINAFNLIARIDLNIINSEFINDINQFNNVDYYSDQIENIKVTKKTEIIDENEYINNLNLPIILNYINSNFEVYMFSKKRYVKTNIVLKDVDNFEVISKKIKSYVLKKKIKNNLCIDCNSFINCYENDIFNSYSPEINCKIIHKLI